MNLSNCHNGVCGCTDKLTAQALGKWAEKQLKPADPKQKICAGKRAGQLEKSLNSISEVADAIAELNPREAKQALLIKQLADSALKAGKGCCRCENGLEEIEVYQKPGGFKTVEVENTKPDYKKLGVYQGALEVISAFQGEKPDSILERAADNLYRHAESINLNSGEITAESYWKHLDIHRDNYLETGNHSLKQVACAFNHHAALAVVSLGVNSRASFLGVKAAAQTEAGKHKGADLNLIANFAQIKDTQMKKGFYAGIRTNELEETQAALGMISALAGQAAETNPNEAPSARLAQKIAQKAIDSSLSSLEAKKRKKPSVSRARNMLGEYHGALKVISSLEPDLNSEAISRGAKKLMTGTEFIDNLKAEDNSVLWPVDEQVVNRARKHEIQGGLSALKEVADAVGCVKAKALIECGSPDCCTLERLSRIKNNPETLDKWLNNQ